MGRDVAISFHCARARARGGGAVRYLPLVLEASRTTLLVAPSAVCARARGRLAVNGESDDDESLMIEPYVAVCVTCSLCRSSPTLDADVSCMQNSAVTTADRVCLRDEGVHFDAVITQAMRAPLHLQRKLASSVMQARYSS